MSIGELPRELGRYDLFDKIAAGGMASVHFGRMHGAVGFQRVVAIKRLHAHYANDGHFVDMFLDEARLAARLKHPNVIQTLDVVADESEVYIVMEFVLGESLEALMPRTDGRPIPLQVIAAIVCNVLEGLHGAHDSLSDMGEPLGIVHRDVSPPNVLVGQDGVARVFDFGIAKAAINTQETRDGVIKGKVTYMAPEQVLGGVDRRADLYAVGVILWELLVARRRHAGEPNDALYLKLASNQLTPLRPASSLRLDAPEGLDAIIARATEWEPENRFATAREMAMAIERLVRPAPAREVAEWLREAAGPRVDLLADMMKRIEGDLAPRSEPGLALLARSSTGSVRVVTASLTSPGGVASSVRPEATTASELHVTGATSAPPRRSWTMPAALIAFSVALLVVGLRTLGNHAAADGRARVDANAAPARPPAESLPGTASSASVTSAATTALTAASTAAPGTSPLAPAPGASVVPAAKAPIGGAPARPSPHVPPPVAIVPSPPATLAASPTAAASPHKAACDNPFVVGPDGIRQIKPECM